MEYHEANSVEQCIEIATCDAENEDEQATGWWNYMDEVFQSVTEVRILGLVVRFEGFDLEGTTLLAVCAKGKNRVKVTLDSITLLGATRVQKLWLKAWNAWQDRSELAS